MLVVAAVIVGAFELESGPKKASSGRTAGKVAHKPTTTTTLPLPPPAVQTALAAPLPTAITQALVLPGPGQDLLIVGGEVADGTSAYGAFLMNTSSGALRQVGDLVAAIHDAAGATLGDQVYVFGGKGSAVSSTVQSFPAPTSTASSTTSTPALSPTTTSTVPAATATGALPQPRAGSVAVPIGTTVYIVGGYDGATAEGSVLSTSDGATFATVARLPVAVRNAAAAVVGGEIYVFGGERLGPAPSSSTAPSSTTAAAHPPAPAHQAETWTAVSDIQRVDPATGQAAVIGHLPTALQDAAAFTLGGHIYVAGGQGPAGVNATIWGFEPANAGLVVAGHLRTPVSGAGVATLGSTAWLVGGQSTGVKLVASVQWFRPKASSAPSPAPGSSRPRATTSSSLVRAG